MPQQRNQSHNYAQTRSGNSEAAWHDKLPLYLPPCPACLPPLLVVVLYFVIKSQAFGYSQGL